MLEAIDTPIKQLADALGIVGEYVDQTGKQLCVTTDATRRALLAAMGVDASSDGAARAALAELRTAERDRRVDSVRVVRMDDASAGTLYVRGEDGLNGRWRLELQLENGDVDILTGTSSDTGPQELHLPRIPTPGYHRLRLSSRSAGTERVDEQTLIVVPPRCVTPADLLGRDTRAFGLTTNLYTLRSGTNWGVGDFGDLGELAAWAGENGADFIGVNPLHALLNRGFDISPYGPLSRLFKNPIYIDVGRVPELAYTPELCERIGSAEFLSGLEPLRESNLVRYEQVMAVKGIALDALHRVFVERGHGDARGRAYERFVADQGTPLDRFALWMAIMERQGTSDWRRWPVDLRSPHSEAAKRFAMEHAARLDFHRWVQFEADRQLGDAADRASHAGMRIGLYQDLAIGVSPAGADAWSFDGLFARGATIGAPPDPYAATGQNWGMPPIDPRALARTGYHYFIQTLRSAFRHAGALRIDHVLGFFRLFWIPEGETALSGAYVRYPANDLLGILALESARHLAVVVGEDLGTVPEEVPPALAKWGVLSSKVLIFERDRDGAFKSPQSYPSLSLATANTHDMSPLAGYWDGRDIDTRVSVGLLPIDEAERARDERERDRIALLDRLAEDDVLPFPVAPASPADLRAAVHELLCRSPAQLVGFALDDVAGELDAVNVPGVGPETHPSWMRKMRQPLEVIMMSDDARASLRCYGRQRPPGSATTSD
ncbi:MAG TPA: 4-alpha-glucanotransferase [Gemmatimonadaceae bacterium]|nr:4-alpha-glucanotransferase [Gemmatimonadaceae bacterium]